MGHDADHVDQVGKHGALDLPVNSTGAAQGGARVDLDEPGLEVRVQKDVEAEELEADVAVGHMGVDLRSSAARVSGDCLASCDLFGVSADSARVKVRACLPDCLRGLISRSSNRACQVACFVYGDLEHGQQGPRHVSVTVRGGPMCRDGWTEYDRQRKAALCGWLQEESKGPEGATK